MDQASQYRNSTIVNLVYKVMLDLYALWQYFETAQGNVVKYCTMGDVGL